MQKVSRRTIARAVAARLIAEPERQAHWIQVLAAYMAAHNLTKYAELMVQDIASELYTQAGVLHASVTSARPLTDSIREQLKAYLLAQTDATTISLDESVDPSLIGGLVAKTPDVEIDLSVRTQLKQLSAIA